MFVSTSQKSGHCQCEQLAAYKCTHSGLRRTLRLNTKILKGTNILTQILNTKHQTCSSSEFFTIQVPLKIQRVRNGATSASQ